MHLTIHRHDKTTTIYKQLFIPTNGNESTKQLVASVMTNFAFLYNISSKVIELCL